jgi:dihydrofolate reductase
LPGLKTRLAISCLCLKQTNEGGINLRKVIVFMMTTPDGYFAGPEGDIYWHNVDEEFNEFANEQLNSVDTLIFGRVTYELMASYWPTPAATTDDPIIAGQMNSLPKVVFSRTLDKAEWHNTRLIKDNVAEEVARLKEQPGKDLIIMGSSNLSASFINLGLIDEFRIMVNPVVLGDGKPLFKGIHDKLNLKLLKSRTFNSGNVLLYYQPADKAG